MASIADKYDELFKRAQQGERPVVLVNACTHGHEQVGAAVIAELEKLSTTKGTLILNIANEKARSLNIPFVESDLNRSFPGKDNGTYEEQLAYHLHPLVSEVDLVIDIHSTNTMSVGEQSAMIVTKLDPETRKLIEAVNPPKVLLMSCTKDNALISDASIGIGIEYGREGEDQTKQRILDDTQTLLIKLGMVKEVKQKSPWSKKTEWYEVVKAFDKDPGCVLDSSIKNYALVKKGSLVAKCGHKCIYAEEDFHPILFGENRYENIFGFIGRKLL
jgi:predicted deacylase